VRLLGERLDELAEADAAERGVVARRQVSGGPDRAGHEAGVPRRGSCQLGRAAVDLERVLAEPPFVELDAAALEGVRLEHVGARLDHRLVHALDHVRAVEHERLVALSLQPPVVRGGEVELLERGAHAAVEDDDPAADGFDVVALGQGRQCYQP
jgi:hypothetical protein